MRGNQMKDQAGKALDARVQAVERGESEQRAARLPSAPHHDGYRRS